MKTVMSTITGFGILPFCNRHYLEASDARQGIAQNPGPSAGTGDGAAVSQATEAGGPTGFTAAPRLSANLIDALIKSQSEQSSGGTSGAETAGPATSLSGVSRMTDQTPASSDPPSGPPTLQQLAAQVDLHHLPHQQ